MKLAMKLRWTLVHCEYQLRLKDRSERLRLPDLDMLEDGDSTEIGAKGVSSSASAHRRSADSAIPGFAQWRAESPRCSRSSSIFLLSASSTR